MAIRDPDVPDAPSGFRCLRCGVPLTDDASYCDPCYRVLYPGGDPEYPPEPPDADDLDIAPAVLPPPAPAPTGANIRRAREKAGMGVAELADRLGVHRNTVANWETCRTEPTGQQLLNIAAALECPPADLLPECAPDDERRQAVLAGYESESCPHPQCRKRMVVRSGNTFTCDACGQRWFAPVAPPVTPAAVDTESDRVAVEVLAERMYVMFMHSSRDRGDVQPPSWNTLAEQSFKAAAVWVSERNRRRAKS